MKSLTEQFTDWVRTKPADEEYDFGDIRNCALAQFGREVLDLSQCQAGSYYIRRSSGSDQILDVLPEDSEIVAEEPNTFGALASRLSASHPTNRSPSGQGVM